MEAQGTTPSWKPWQRRARRRIGRRQHHGGGGDDWIMGWTGNDQVAGGPGDDLVAGTYMILGARLDDGDPGIGRAQTDVVGGAEGDDLVFDNEGDETLSGGRAARPHARPQRVRRRTSSGYRDTVAAQPVSTSTAHGDRAGIGHVRRVRGRITPGLPPDFMGSNGPDTWSASCAVEVDWSGTVATTLAPAGAGSIRRVGTGATRSRSLRAARVPPAEARGATPSRSSGRARPTAASASPSSPGGPGTD